MMRTKFMRSSVFFLVLSGVTSLAVAQVTNSSSPSLAVTTASCTNAGANGNGAGGVTDAISFTETGTISDVNVQVQFTTTTNFRDTLQFHLTYSGGGGIVILGSDDGILQTNYFAIFDDEGTNTCEADCLGPADCANVPGPTCRPQDALSAFDGLTSPGTWTLSVCSDTADVPILLSWSVTLSGDGQLPVKLESFSVQ